MAGPERFVRVPTEVIEVLLRGRLSGGQYRVLLWVIRHTFGWNRRYVPVTWYRMAQELGLSRPAVYRAGRALLAAGILVEHEKQLAIQLATDDGGQLSIPGLDVASKQRLTLPGSNATVAGAQPKRCRQATLSRRAKDSSKDRLKTYKDRPWHKNDGVPHSPTATDNTNRRLLAGAARPIPGKYDSLSQN